jgi:hypothetical protein
VDGSLGAALLIGTPERFAIDGDDVGTEFGEGGNPGDEAVLELFSIEGSEQIPELVMGGRAIRKGAEPAQKRKLGFTELCNFDPALGAGQNRQQAKQQHLIERIPYLAALARILKRFEMFQPFNDLIVGALRLRLSLRHRNRPPRIRGRLQIQQSLGLSITDSPDRPV